MQFCVWLSIQEKPVNVCQWVHCILSERTKNSDRKSLLRQHRCEWERKTLARLLFVSANEKIKEERLKHADCACIFVRFVSLAQSYAVTLYIHSWPSQRYGCFMNHNDHSAIKTDEFSYVCAVRMRLIDAVCRSVTNCFFFSFLLFQSHQQ